MKKITMLILMTLTATLMGHLSYGQYCTPEGTNVDRYINDFSTSSGSLNITNENSGFSTGGYGDYTSLTVQQGVGGVVNFTVNVAGGTAGFRIWVDWNNDEQFDETTEVVYQSNEYLDSRTGSFTVPGDATEGPTRMRIVSHWLSTTGNIGPCATGFTYGEFEDYTINVGGSAIYDCPDLEVNFGSTCDDGDSTTINDVIDADCNCTGISVATNDEACTATALSCGDSITQSLSGSTPSFDDSCFGDGAADVWFSFSSDGSQLITVTETSPFDAVVQLFIGDDCGNLTEAGACKDSPENYSITEAGNYYFRVRPYFSTDETETITVSLTCVDFDCPAEQANFGDACNDGDSNTVNDVIGEDCNCSGDPVAINDNCSGAIALVCGETITDTTDNATASGLPSECGIFTSNDARDLFYSFEADGTSNYKVSLNQPSGSTGLDGVLFVYSGNCGELTSIECSDSGNPEEIELSSPAAGTYIVRLFDYSGTAEFTLSLECTPLSINENDAFAQTRLFPNPLNDTTFFIQAPKLNGERVEVNILDMAGRQIYNNALNCIDNKITVPVNETLNSGMYLVMLKYAGESHTFRLIKE